MLTPRILLSYSSGSGGTHHYQRARGMRDEDKAYLRAQISLADASDVDTLIFMPSMACLIHSTANGISAATARDHSSPTPARPPSTRLTMPENMIAAGAG